MAPTSVSEWIPVLAPTYSLPLRSEYPFTLHQSVAQDLSYMWQWRIQGRGTGAQPYLFSDQTEARTAEKFFVETPPLISGFG